MDAATSASLPDVQPSRQHNHVPITMVVHAILRFWEVYTDQLLPQPEALALPMCWHTDLLQQLQHDAIIAAAQQQQVSSLLSQPCQFFGASGVMQQLQVICRTCGMAPSSDGCTCGL